MQTPQKEGKIALFKPLCLRTLVTVVRERDVPRKGLCCHSHPHASPLLCVGGTSRPLLLQRTSGVRSSRLLTLLCSLRRGYFGYLSSLGFTFLLCKRSVFQEPCVKMKRSTL